MSTQLTPEEVREEHKAIRRELLSSMASLILIVAAVVLFVVGAVVGFTAYRVDSVARDTNRILRVEVQEKDAQIADLTYIIEEQATPAILHMIGQLQAAEIAPPVVLLNPHCPPFNPAATTPPKCPAKPGG